MWIGRMSIAVAKRLRDGKVTGIDIWDKKHLGVIPLRGRMLTLRLRGLEKR
ncbi:MAG: hypothetical protein QW172_05315 [Candidatus Bathyarchaeia archaeon]